MSGVRAGLLVFGKSAQLATAVRWKQNGPPRLDATIHARVARARNTGSAACTLKIREPLARSALISNCPNNCGAFQFPEKLIPAAILNARERKPVPVHGDGLNVRDWLEVDYHVDARLLIAQRGRVGRCTLSAVAMSGGISR